MPSSSMRRDAMGYCGLAQLPLTKLAAASPVPAADPVFEGLLEGGAVVATALDGAGVMAAAADAKSGVGAVADVVEAGVGPDAGVCKVCGATGLGVVGLRLVAFDAWGAGRGADTKDAAWISATLTGGMSSTGVVTFCERLSKSQPNAA